jgi:hypothetical protein
LNRVPSGKFNRVNVLIRGNLSAMRDVAFLVRLPEGGDRYSKVPASSGRNWPGISVYPGLQSGKPSSEVKNLQKRMMLNY